MAHQRFNRHEIYTNEMLDETMNLIRDVESFSKQTTGRYFGLSSLTNMLYGLFDGYLYEDLLPESKVTLSDELYVRINSLVEFIQKNS